MEVHCKYLKALCSAFLSMAMRDLGAPSRYGSYPRIFLCAFPAINRFFLLLEQTKEK